MTAPAVIDSYAAAHTRSMYPLGTRRHPGIFSKQTKVYPRQSEPRNRLLTAVERQEA
jgi:hypothetical protein